MMQVVLSFFSFDVDVLRPDCLMDPISGFATFVQMPYMLKWFVQWMSPYIIVGMLVLGLGYNCLRHKKIEDPRFIHFKTAALAVISVQFLLQSMSHFADNLIFSRCMPCEGSQICLVEYPLIMCGSGAWMFMAMISMADLLLVMVPLLIIIFLAMYKSWAWQHGAGTGFDKKGRQPWHISVSECWVVGFRGYSYDLRKEAVTLREFLRKVIDKGVEPHKVWEHCVFMTRMEKWKFYGTRLREHMDKLVVLLDKERNHDMSQAMKEVSKASKKGNPTELSRRSFSSISVDQIRELHQTKLTAAEERKEETDALSESMDDLTHFMKAQGVTGKTFERGSAFYSYSWQWVMCLQKVFVVVIAMGTPPDSGAMVMAGCLLFMLLVLVVQVDLEPHEWNFLNDVAEVMDIGVVYMIVFAQLAWEGPLVLVSFLLLAVTVVPVALRQLLPRVAPKRDRDEDVCDAVEKDMKMMFGDSESKVKLAVMSALLANGGMQTLSRAQNRIRERLHQKAEDARQRLQQDNSAKVMPDISQPMVDVEETEVRPNPSGVTMYSVAATNNPSRQNGGLAGITEF